MSDFKSYVMDSVDNYLRTYDATPKIVTGSWATKLHGFNENFNDIDLITNHTDALSLAKDIVMMLLKTHRQSDYTFDYRTRVLYNGKEVITISMAPLNNQINEDAWTQIVDISGVSSAEFESNLTTCVIYGSLCVRSIESLVDGYFSMINDGLSGNQLQSLIAAKAATRLSNICDAALRYDPLPHFVERIYSGKHLIAQFNSFLPLEKYVWCENVVVEFDDTEYKETIAEAQSKLETLEKEALSMRSENAFLTESNQELAKNVADLEDSIRKKDVTHQKRISGLEKKLKEASVESADGKNRIRGLELEISVLNQQAKRYKDIIEENRRQCDSAYLRIATLEADIKKMRQTIMEKSQQKPSPKSDISVIRQEYKAELSEANCMIESLNKKCDDLVAIHKKEMEELSDKHDLEHMKLITENKSMTDRLTELLFQSNVLNESLGVLVQCSYHMWDCDWLTNLHCLLGKLGERYEKSIVKGDDPKTVTDILLFNVDIISNQELYELDIQVRKAYEDCSKMKKAMSDLCADLITHKSNMFIHKAEIEKHYTNKEQVVKMNSFVLKLLKDSMIERERSSNVHKQLSKNNMFYKDMLKKFVELFERINDVVSSVSDFEEVDSLKLTMYEELFEKGITYLKSIEVNVKEVECHIMSMKRSDLERALKPVEKSGFGIINASDELETIFENLMDGKLDDEFQVEYERVSVLERAIVDKERYISNISDKLIQANKLNHMYLDRIKKLQDKLKKESEFSKTLLMK